jgi:hypothetical protein
MDSPFPGMDPYLESHWGDVHHALITYARDQIQPRLPRDLRARLVERDLAGTPNDEERGIYLDVRVVKRPRQEDGGATAVMEEVDEPLVILLDEGYTEGFIEIVEAGTRDHAITVIEILSPSIKRAGRDRDAYFEKREELTDAGINLVEIDLLRSGQRILGHPRLHMPVSHRTAYQICVHRGRRPVEYEIYRAPLRERLPRIRIPLRESDSDALLDLQDLVAQAYRNGAYDDVDYRLDPVPTLDPADAGWADALQREKGRR